MNRITPDYSLYLVTDRDLLEGRDFANCLDAALEGGSTVLQLREKNASTREFLERAFEAKRIASQYGVPLIINDRLDIALAVDAEGLHVGQSDLPLPTARKLLGPHKIIGVSVSTLEEALLAEQQGADYLGVGAMFPTSTKDDAKIVSLQQLEVIKHSVNIPVVAIGGINASNLLSIMETGIDGICVVSAILGHPDIQQAASNLKNLLKKVGHR